jgi:hypothetical protein
MTSARGPNLTGLAHKALAPEAGPLKRGDKVHRVP